MIFFNEAEGLEVMMGISFNSTNYKDSTIISGVIRTSPNFGTVNKMMGSFSFRVQSDACGISVHLNVLFLI